MVIVVVKGRYGYADFNSNGILDNDNEYISGYALTNLSFRKSILKNFEAILGVDNLFDKKNPELTPEYPGRIIYGGLNFNL